MSVALADGYTQLALHVLAHVPQGGPGELHDPRYVAWSTRTLGDDGLARDGALIGARWRERPALSVLHALPELFGSIAQLRRAAARPLAALARDEVAAPALLGALQAADAVAVELAFAALGLAARRFEACLRATIIPALTPARAAVAAAIEALTPAFPGLAEARIEVVWALGGRGRALPERILVGAPAAWLGLDPATPAVVAAHEQSVRVRGAEPYAVAEWRALIDVADRIAGAPAALRDAHARWLAGLDLSSVARGAIAAGLATPADAAALAEPRRQAEHLAGLAARL